MIVHRLPDHNAKLRFDTALTNSKLSSLDYFTPQKKIEDSAILQSHSPTLGADCPKRAPSLRARGATAQKLEGRAEILAESKIGSSKFR